MDFLDLVVYRNVYREIRNQKKRAELTQRASDLNTPAGEDALSYHQFAQMHPTPQPNSTRNATIGAVVGAVILGAIAASFFGAVLGSAYAFMGLLPAVGGAVAGGMIGYFSDTPAKHEEDMLGQYEHYLNRFETARGVAMTMDKSEDLSKHAEIDHVRRLEAERKIKRVAALSM